MKYGLPQHTVDKICAVLAQHPQVERAVLYGSRAKGNYKPGSDIDLTLFGSALTQQRCASIADALDDLLLPYTIDLSLFAQLQHPELEAHIQRVGQVFYVRKEGDSALPGLTSSAVLR
jgi:predicted nucleotidyltransferase